MTSTTPLALLLLLLLLLLQLASIAAGEEVGPRGAEPPDPSGPRGAEPPDPSGPRGAEPPDPSGTIWAHREQSPSHLPDDDRFLDWAQRHGKSYATAADREAAFANFRAALRRVREINQVQGSTWWADTTRLSDRSPEELRRTLLRPVDPEYLARRARELELGRHSACPLGARTCAVESILPPPAAAVDWRALSRVTPVRDQGGCGACWAFAGTSLVESAYLKATNATAAQAAALHLSEQQLVSCSKAAQGFMSLGCTGGYAWDALNYVIHYNLTTAAAWPYSGTDEPCAFAPQHPASVTYGNAVRPAQWSSTLTVPPTRDAMLAAVAAYPGGVAVGFQVDSDFYWYGGGVFPSASACGSYIDHYLVVVGYNLTAPVPYWIVKNSWSTGWGEQGYARLGMQPEPCGIYNFSYALSTSGFAEVLAPAVPSTYVGCFSSLLAGNATALLLPNWLAFPPGAAANSYVPGSCAQAAQKLGYTAYALQYGGTCWAANLTAASLAARGAPAPGGCSSACLTDASQTCGGAGNAVSVYLLAPSTYVGCFSSLLAGNATALLLPNWMAFPPGAAANSYVPGSCALAAQKLGYTAYALQYGGTCWAANLTAASLAARGTPAPGGCTSACLSDSSQTCGGAGNAVSVYLLAPSSSYVQAAETPAEPIWCAVWPGYRFRSQVNVPGHNLLPERVEPGRARLECNAHPGCLAFNTGGLLKSAMGPLEAWPPHAHGYGDPCTGVYVRTTPNL
jgi:hypothetical protein